MRLMFVLFLSLIAQGQVIYHDEFLEGEKKDLEIMERTTKDQTPLKEHKNPDSKGLKTEKLDKKPIEDDSNKNHKIQVEEFPKGNKITYSREELNAGSSIVFEGNVNESHLFIGHILRAELVNTVKSSNMRTPVLVRTLVDEYNRGDVIVPYGTTMIGQAGASPISERLEIEFQYITLPGRQVSCQAIGLSSDGSAGVLGFYFDRKGRLIAGNLI
jgi:hypothetical protein